MSGASVKTPATPKIITEVTLGETTRTCPPPAYKRFRCVIHRHSKPCRASALSQLRGRAR
jgi:hypothetical protein